MNRRKSILSIVLATCSMVILLCGACGAQKTGDAKAPQTQATPRTGFTAADVAKLKWIEGTWRGTGETQPPFFERYRLDGDSALVVESFEDESLAKVSDTSRFELREGKFGNWAGERHSAASEITADYVQFVPAGGPGNSFRFERTADPNTWKAVLDWPARNDKPARQVIYTMVRYEKVAAPPK